MVRVNIGVFHYISAIWPSDGWYLQMFGCTWVWHRSHGCDVGHMILIAVMWSWLGSDEVTWSQRKWYHESLDTSLGYQFKTQNENGWQCQSQLFASLSHNYSGTCQICDSKNSFKMNIVDIYTLFEVGKAAGKHNFQLLFSQAGDSQQWRISFFLFWQGVENFRF